MIDLSPAHLATVRRLLSEHVPECEVRAFGSRVAWTAKNHSDLDLALVGSKKLALSRLRRLREDFEESNLPVRVDILDWHAISATFKKVILNRYEVIHQPDSTAAGRAGVSDRTSWRKTPLADVIDMKHGYAFPGENIRDTPPGDVLVTPGNFAIGGGFKGDKYKYFDGVVPEAYVLHEGDLVVTMTDLSKQADTLGYPALIPKTGDSRFLHNQRIGKIIIKPGVEVDKRFLFYLLRTAEYRDEVLASATGTTVKHTSPGRILAYKATFPPLPEQKAIAEVLGALDDKIELNRRMNVTLEGMARALFQSWFVDFEPVRAKIDGRKPMGMDVETEEIFPSKFQESSIGRIPYGWSVQCLPKVIDVNPRRTLKAGVVAPYLDMKNLPTQGHSAIEVINREFSSGTKFRNGDTLLARITPCLENGKTGYVDFLEADQVGWGSTEYIVLAPKPPLPSQFGYLLARSEALRVHAIQNMTGTSGRQRVPAGCFNSFQLAVPPLEVARCFGVITKPLMAKIKANSQNVRTLTNLRDALLPELINGHRLRDVGASSDRKRT